MADLSFHPDWFSKPGETLLTLMERSELSSEDLARRLDCDLAVVRGLLAGTVVIDHFMADALSRSVGGSARFWEARQQKYQHALSRVTETAREQNAEEWIKLFPHTQLAQGGYITPTRKRSELVKAYLSYFGVSSPAEWKSRYANAVERTVFRTSPTFHSKIGPLSAWLRQGEIEAAQLRCAPWSGPALKARLAEIRTLCKAKNPEYYLPRLRRICAEAGVAIIFARAPSGCRASGATRFIAPQKAMMLLSFRYLSDDHFWFTLFHELAHLMLHDKSLTFIEGEERELSDMEREANEFSERILIPSDRRDEMMDLRARRNEIIRFAMSVGVSPGVVVGQLQHHRVLKRNQMNGLKRRFDLAQIESVPN